MHFCLTTYKETPKIAQTIRDMADAAISTADDLVEIVGGMITPTTHGSANSETKLTERKSEGEDYSNSNSNNPKCRYVNISLKTLVIR